MTLILGRKRGMTQLFAEDGTVTGVTVVEAGPCVVTQVKTQEKSTATPPCRSGYEDVRDSLVRKTPEGPIQEVRCRSQALPSRGPTPRRGYHRRPWATQVTVDQFEVGDLVDVIGTTKGRGFAGTIQAATASRAATRPTAA